MYLIHLYPTSFKNIKATYHIKQSLCVWGKMNVKKKDSSESAVGTRMGSVCNVPVKISLEVKLTAES